MYELPMYELPMYEWPMYELAYVWIYYSLFTLQ